MTAAEVAEELADQGVESRPADDVPEGLVLNGQFDAHGSQLFREGAIMPQSRASMLVARALDPQPGDRVLDMCAAPGAKTTHLAALSATTARSWLSRSTAGARRRSRRTASGWARHA